MFFNDINESNRYVYDTEYVSLHLLMSYGISYDTFLLNTLYFSRIPYLLLLKLWTVCPFVNPIVCCALLFCITCYLSLFDIAYFVAHFDVK